MARKTLADLKEGSMLWSGADGERFGRQLSLADAVMDDKTGRHAKSWVVVGIDTSMSCIAATAMGFDSTLGRMTKVGYKDIRWTIEDIDYLHRLRDAAKAHELVIDAMPIGIPLDRVHIYQEEPVPLGMMKSGRIKFESGWIKQQCEVSGAVLGSLVRWGFTNVSQINNAQWKAVLRKEGVKIRKMPEGKWDVRDWAIQAFGLPDLPDLVKSKTGSKIPRPESGYGANAKAIQPDDIYDAAAVMAFGINDLQSKEIA